MLCIQCQSEACNHYRMNQNGELFCNDDCYDIYMSENDHAPDDHNHPYIDEYEAIRTNYIDWLDHWEKDLENAFIDDVYNKSGNGVLLTADEMNDKIDEVFESFFDYYQTEGDDGVFAKEIYGYLLKFENLQRKILDWRPDEREIYYHFSLWFKSGAFNKDIYDTEQFYTLLVQMEENDLFKELKEHQHPYDTLAFVYENQEDVDQIQYTLAQKFGNKIEDMGSSEAHLCDGGCGDYEDICDVNMNDLNGWFFCCSCSEKYLPGFFTKDDLLKEIQFMDADDNFVEHSKFDSWHYYIRKIKRSCRYHDFEFPDWIDLNYEW